MSDIKLLAEIEHHFKEYAPGSRVHHDKAQGLLQRAEAELKRECTWTNSESEFGPDWEGSCGAAWDFMEGGPEDNGVYYCPQCGGKVVIDAP